MTAIQERFRPQSSIPRSMRNHRPDLNKHCHRKSAQRTDIYHLRHRGRGDAAVSPNITHPAEGHVQVYLTVDESGKGGFSFHP